MVQLLGSRSSCTRSTRCSSTTWSPPFRPNQHLTTMFTKSSSWCLQRVHGCWYMWFATLGEVYWTTILAGKCTGSEGKFSFYFLTILYVRKQFLVRTHIVFQSFLWIGLQCARLLVFKESKSCRARDETWLHRFLDSLNTAPEEWSGLRMRRIDINSEICMFDSILTFLLVRLQL